MSEKDQARKFQVEIDKERVIRNVEKYAKKYQPSNKILFLVALLGAIIGLVSVPQPINQEWAWQVAGSIITINSLIMGFSILGLTVFSERGYSKSIFKKLAEESADNLITDLERLGKTQKEVSNKELIERILSNTLHPFIDIQYLREIMLISMKYSLMSIGCCLLLFGVTPERINDPLLRFTFYAVYSMAIAMFIWSAYSIIYGISAIVKRSTEINTEQGVNIAMDAFTRKLDELRKKSESDTKS